MELYKGHLEKSFRKKLEESGLKFSENEEETLEEEEDKKKK